MASSTHYLIKGQPESALLVSSNSTVQNDVGICYFDPIDETLKELNLLNGLILTIQPYKKAIKKYYLVVNPTSSALNYVRIVPTFGSSNVTPTDYYSIKTIISSSEPTLGNYDDLVSMNSFKIINPAPGAIIPIWVFVESLLPLNAILNVAFTVTYA
jgi:hypothetical protein